MIIVLIFRHIGLNKIYVKTNFTCFIFFFNVAARKCQIIYVARIQFLLASVALAGWVEIS